MAIKIAQRQIDTGAVAVPETRVIDPMKEAFGGNVAEAQGQGKAEVAGQLAGVLEKQALRKQKEKNDRYALDLDTSFRNSVQDKLYNDDDEQVMIEGQMVTRKKGVLKRTLETSAGSTEELDDWLESQMSDIESKAYTPEMKISLAKSVHAYSRSVRGTVISHEAKQDGLVTDLSYETNMTKMVNEEAPMKNADELPDFIDVIRERGKEYAITKGILDEDAQKMVSDKYVNKAIDNNVALALENSPEYAFTVLESIKDKLTPTEYDERKKTLISLYDNQRAEENFQAVLAVNSLDDQIKQLIATNQFDLLVLNSMRDANPLHMDKLYDKYKDIAIQLGAQSGRANKGVGYEILADFRKIWGDKDVKDLKDSKQAFWWFNKKFDDNLKLRAKVSDGIISGDIDSTILKTINPLFEATTTENKQFQEQFLPYLEALDQVELFAQKMRTQDLRFKELYGDKVSPEEDLTKELIFDLYSEFLRLSDSDKTLQNIGTNVGKIEELRKALSSTMLAYSEEIARQRFNISTDKDGNEFVETGDGSVYKVTDYSFGVPVIQWNEVEKTK